MRNHSDSGRIWKMSDDEPTPARRPSAIQSVHRWGLVYGWVNGGAGKRKIELLPGDRHTEAFVALCQDEKILVLEPTMKDEDPSKAIVRAIMQLAPEALR